MNSLKTYIISGIICLLISPLTFGQHFRVEPTESNHSLLVEAALLNGRPLQENDEIGVFTPGDFCAGAALVDEPGVRLGIAAWGAEQGQDNGFRPGDAFRFRFWDAGARREAPAEPDWLEGPEVFEANALSVLDLIARADERPHIALSDSAHSFGAVRIGRSSLWTLTIRNIGGELLSGEIVIAGEFFRSANVGEFRIAPDAQFNVEIIFEPGREGEFAGRASIFSNDPQRGALVVNLSGSGVQDRHYRYVETETSHSILVQRAEVDGEPLWEGCEIGVFTPDGVCAGAVVIEQAGERVGLAVWAAEQGENNGFREGQPFEFRFWGWTRDFDAVEFEIPAEAEWIEGPEEFEGNGISVVNLAGELNIVRPPRLELSANEHNFGNVLAGAAEVWTLNIRNAGGVDLRAIFTTEGRFFSDDNEDGISLEPGASADVSVTFAPEQEGQFNGFLIVESNDPQNGFVEVPLRGRGVREEVHFEYEITADNMSLLVASARLDGLLLVRGDEIGVFTPADLCAGAVEITGEWPVGIAVWADDPGVEGLQGFRDGESLQFRIWDLSSNREYEALPRYIEGQGVFHINEFAFVELLARSQNAPILTLSADAHDFGLVLTGGERAWQLTVSNLGNADLTLRDVQTDNEAFVCEFEDSAVVEPFAEFDLQVVFRPQAVGDIEGTLIIFSSDPDRLEAAVRLSGQAVAAGPPRMELSANQHDFGEAPVGQTRTWELVIFNRGGDTLNIEDLTVEGAGFFVEPAELFSIDIGGSDVVRITFSPEEEIRYNAQLIIVSDDPDNRQARVGLVGRGAPPQFHWQFIQTDNNMSALILRNDDAPIEAGAEIGVFTPRGRCAGAAIVDEFPIGLAAWGDDPTTQDIIEGFRDGEALAFRVWFPQAGAEFGNIGAEWVEGDSVYTANGFGALRLWFFGEPQEFDWDYQPSDISHSLLVQSARFGRVFLAEGDAAGVFTPGGRCAGYTILEDPGDEAFGIAVWADEGGDEDILGFRADEPFDFRFWVADEGREWQAWAIWVEGDRTFTANGFSVLQLIGGPLPRIEMEDEHSFGNVPLDRTIEWELVIRNVGEDVLSITDIEGSGEPFMFAFEDAVDINPDSQTTIIIEFTPREVRQYERILIVRSNDQLRPAVEVALTGAGRIPNRPPVWMDIPQAIEGEEGEILEFTLVGRDPDSDDLTITYSSEDLPDSVVFTDYHNGRGRFSWRPTFRDAGEYTARFTLADDEFAVAGEVHISIADVNQPPEIIRNIPDIRVQEDTPGRRVIADLDEVFRDADGDNLSYNVEAVEELRLEIADNILTYWLVEDYNGESVVIVSADDRRETLNNAAVSFNEGRAMRQVGRRAVPQRDAVTPLRFTFTVLPVNDVPVWEEYPRQPIRSREGDLIEFTVLASDVDNDRLNLTLERDGLPEAARFEQTGDSTGRFTWQTTFNDAGNYSPIFIASDGALPARAEVQIIVDNVNRAPAINQPSDQPVHRIVVDEGRELRIDFRAVDPDNDRLTWRLFDPNGLPGGHQFTDNGNGTALFVWTPGFDAAGQYSPRFAVHDPDGAGDSLTVEIAVREVNRPPVIEEPADHDTLRIAVDEMQELSLEFTARDLDGDRLIWRLAFTGGRLDGYEFTDNGNGTARFVWTPDYEMAGSYNPLFEVSDNIGGIDSLRVLITVRNVNRPPVVDRPIPDVIANEGDGWREIVDLDTIFSDPDRDTLAYSLRDNPPQLGMRILQGRTLVINPAQDYNLPDGAVITVIAADPGGLSADTTFWVTIRAVNDAPSPFSLLAPLDGSILNNFRADFIWQQSIDIDGDQVRYDFLFHIVNQQPDTTLRWCNLADTTLQMAGMDTILTRLGIDDTVWVEWWVMASDGQAERESNQRWTLRLPPPSAAPRYGEPLPSEVTLSPAYPNPFNPLVRLSIAIPTPEFARLTVWNSSGRMITTLTSRMLPAGRHPIEWNAKGMANGVYLFILETKDKRIVSKGVLLR